MLLFLRSTRHQIQGLNNTLAYNFVANLGSYAHALQRRVCVFIFAAVAGTTQFNGRTQAGKARQRRVPIQILVWNGVKRIAVQMKVRYPEYISITGAGP